MTSEISKELRQGDAQPALVDQERIAIAPAIFADYRDVFYKKYASVVQDVRIPLTPAEAMRWGSPYRRYLRGWLPQNKDAAILDSGCGTGRLSYFLKRLGYQHVTGIDASSEMVQMARGLHNDVIEGNTLEHLADHPDEYDLILSIDVIEHLTRAESIQFVEYCHHALKPGGRVVIQTPNGESIWRGENLHGDFTHQMCLNPKSLRQLLEISRFTNMEARELGPVPHGLVSFCRTALWKLMRWRMMFANLVETGDTGSGVFTRVFIMSATKPV